MELAKETFVSPSSHGKRVKGWGDVVHLVEALARKSPRVQPCLSVNRVCWHMPVIPAEAGGAEARLSSAVQPVQARLSLGGRVLTGSNKGRKKWKDAHGHVSEQVGKLRFRELHRFPDGITAGGKSLGRWDEGVRADLGEGRTLCFFPSARTPRSLPPLLGAVLERGSARQGPAMFPVGMALGSPTPSKWLPSPWPLG